MSTDPKSPNPRQQKPDNHGFSYFASRSSSAMGSSPAFLAAIVLIVLWGVTGPHFHFSDTWQMIINTATTVITFLMVFLIQNTQNRDARALHLKLDEIIRALRSAHNEMIDVERLSDVELERLAKSYERLRQAAASRRSLRRSEEAPGRPEDGSQELRGRLEGGEETQGRLEEGGEELRGTEEQVHGKKAS